MTLNGTWLCHVTDNGTHNYTIEARVPGCVHTDLQRAGILGDLFYRKNAEDCQWVERCDVSYTRTFSVEAEEAKTDAVLYFAGLDTYCTVFLNGNCIGEADDMFVSFRFPTKGFLHPGENTVEVHFRSPVREVESLPPRSGAFTTERLYTRRMQCTYGWDWVARFVTMGIWKDAALELPRADRLEHLYVYTNTILPDGDGGSLAQIGINAAFAALTGNGEAEFVITDPEGKTVFSRTRRILPSEKDQTETTLAMYADLAHAQLWYPHGYGAQPLYTLEVRQNGEIVKTQTFGIRTVAIAEVEDASDSVEAVRAKNLKTYAHMTEWDKNEGSSSFILYINGIRIFCTGANWVPAEPFPSAETAEKLEHLVRLARDGGYTMLRVWGGGIFEHDAFYDACDRYGILVTQDFLMACGVYPEEDDAFIDHLRLEAKEAALALRNHPCLVYWSGDNENAILGDENMAQYSGRRAALEGIGPVLAVLDPHRRFLPSSPYGGKPYASGVRGTTHNTQFLGNFFAYIREGNFDAYQAYFAQYLARFCAEQPAMGMPYVSSLRRFMTDEDIFGDDVSVSEYHTKNNPGLGDITLYGYLDRMARGMFGDYKDGADRIAKMQLLHCEWIRLSLELFRRNAWFSSGIVYWMFNDCWPAANSWSMVDYYGAPKPGYYMFRRAAKPIIVSIAREGEDKPLSVTVCHRGCDTVSGTVRLYRYHIPTGAEETLAHLSFTSLCNESRVLYSFADSADIGDSEWMLLCDLTSDAGEGEDRAYYLPLAWKYMAWDDTPSFTVAAEDDTTLTVHANTTVPVLLLDVPYLLSDNSMFLKRGETVCITKIRHL